MRLSWSRFALMAAATLLTPTLFAQPQMFPNSQKYKDSSVKNATGHAGTATVEARALYNRDKSTDFDLTTGSFDGGNATGTLAKVQLQFPTGAAKNFDVSTSTFSTSLAGLSPHATLGINANVRGVDGNRTDVVMLNETVKRRPDLSAAGITGPSTAIRGRSFVVWATLRELNGDVGARTDVRLYANGQMIDRVENAWVDANGVADFAFAPSLDLTGPVTLTVKAESVNPGDWDTANNEASMQVALKEQTGEFYSWTTDTREQQFRHFLYEKYSWGESTTDQKGIDQVFQFNGVLRAQTGQSNLSAHLKVTSDGQTLYDATAGSGEFVGPYNTWFGTCSLAYANGEHPEVTVCYSDWWSVTQVEVYAGAGDVVYRSYGWGTQRSPWSPPEPRFEWNYTYTQNNMNGRFGSEVTVQVDYEDSGNKYSATQSMPIGAPEVFQIDRDYGCYYEDFFGYEVCNEIHDWRSTRRGSGYGFSQ